MPNQPKTPSRTIRIPDVDWADLEQLAASRGTERGELIRSVMAWWMRRPGARMPPRPPAR
jgi:hypothetical protein